MRHPAQRRAVTIFLPCLSGKSGAGVTVPVFLTVPVFPSPQYLARRRAEKNSLLKRLSGIAGEERALISDNIAAMRSYLQ
jgi:hypothetical protein